MESNYSSKYSGEQVDAAVEYFLNHSQTQDASEYTYTNTIYCKYEGSGFPAQPFASLPVTMPELPFTGSGGNVWYDVPNSSSKDWFQCVLKINYKSKKVISQSSVLDMKGLSGDKGADGTNGSNGENGTNGTNGTNGNYTEYRYTRASKYALTLGSVQKASRNPEGWSTDWDEAGTDSYNTLITNLCNDFDSYVLDFSTIQSLSPNNKEYFTGIDDDEEASFEYISTKFSSLHEVEITATALQKTTIVEAFNAYRALYLSCNKQASDLLTCNTEYHRLYTKYINEDHFWVLFMIYATIDGTYNTIIGEWSSPQRIQGVDGKSGPAGSNGVSGIPGVNIGVAFTLGTDTAIRKDAANPQVSPYKDTYDALFAPNTYWFKSAPEVTEEYPYIWFTQCRYYPDSNNTKVFESGESWSTPMRYTGLNGVQTTEYVRNPIIYPMGIYTAGVQYVNDGVRTPYVYFVDEDGNGNYYYLAGQGSWIGSDSSTPKSDAYNSTTGEGWWALLEGFEALYTKVGIIANGLIGSAVFNGDYMFSQIGSDENGQRSTKYHLFCLSASNGSTLDSPYDDDAQFKPNFCINFRTGEMWSNTVNTKLSVTSDAISLSVQDNIEGKLRATGIDITSGEIKVNGTFSGTSNGTFAGAVKAKELTVMYADDTPAITFGTYDKDTMGDPEDSSTIEDGTPVVIVNHGGNHYVLSMVKLVTGTNTSRTYKKIEAITESLSTTDSIDIVGGKVSISTKATYKKMTSAPYMALLDSSGNQTGTTITAKLYDNDGVEQDWSNYLNKYYLDGKELITEEYSDIHEGIWKFRLNKDNLASSEYVYNTTPTNMTLAVVDTSSGSPIYIGDTSFVYSKITITNGVLTGSTYDKVAVGYKVTWNSNSQMLTIDSSYVTYLKGSQGYTATYLTSTGASTTSSYFAVVSDSVSIWTGTELTNCATIVKAPSTGGGTTPGGGIQTTPPSTSD
jgi:hypothetical protein